MFGMNVAVSKCKYMAVTNYKANHACSVLLLVKLTGSISEQPWSQQPLPPTFISIPLSPQERWTSKPLSIYLRLQVSRRGNLEDCFQQRVLLFAFTEEKMIACSLTVALFLLSSTSAAGEVNMKRMENR